MADSPGLFAMRQTFSRSLTIDHLQVGSALSNFPILVRFTNSTFKTVANGGHVETSNAFTFSSDSAGTSLYKWEIERHNVSTGELIAWVKIPSIGTGSDTVFYMRYGGLIANDQSDPVNVWTNSYLGVYHLTDGSTLNVQSSTKTNNGINNGATATTGQIDGGASFVSASSQYVNLGNQMSGVSPAAITYSAWINATSFPNAYNAVVTRNAAANIAAVLLLVKSTGKLACAVRGQTGAQTYDGTGTNTLSAATDYYLCLTYDNVSAGVVGYVNGSSDGTAAQDGALNSTTAETDIGQDSINAGRFWNGVIDEVRVASVARNADWIALEYNNQKPGGTVVSLGSET